MTDKRVKEMWYEDGDLTIIDEHDVMTKYFNCHAISCSDFEDVSSLPVVKLTVNFNYEMNLKGSG